MISFSSKLPVLQIANYQLHDYDTRWLLLSIELALKSVKINDEKIAFDIYSGVVHYLKNDCPWVPLKVEDLYLKVAKLFDKIGFPHAKNKIPRFYPTIPISVLEELEELDYPIELLLFGSLNAELDRLNNYGVRSISFEKTIEAVSVLLPSKRWNKRCQQLHDEITSLELDYNARMFYIDEEAVDVVCPF